MTNNFRTQQLESNIEHTRARLDNTLDNIQAKLSPLHMVEQLASISRAGGGEFISNMGRAAREKPMPTALLTLAIGWMLMSSGKDSGSGRAQDTDADRNRGPGLKDRLKGRAAKVSEKAHAMEEKVADKAHAFEDRLSDKAHAIEETLEDKAKSTLQSAHDARGKVQSKVQTMYEDTQSKVKSAYDTVHNRYEEQAAMIKSLAEDTMQNNPLAAGALMVAAGALLGGLLPVSERERTLMGSRGKQVNSLARKAVQRGSETVQRIAGAALKETGQAIEDISQASQRPTVH